MSLSDSETKRAEQVDALVAWAAERTLPVVAVGTFNFGLGTDGSGGEGERQKMSTSGWQWVMPATPVGAFCDGRSPVQDFVFLAGSAPAWAARSDVMFPQKNYCPDDDRTSDHRPVLANLETSGGEVVVTGSMPGREIRPVFPDTVITVSDAQIRLAEGPEQVHPAPVNAPAEPVPEADNPAVTGTAQEQPSRAELLRRMERLEAELQSLRRQIGARPE